VPEEWILEIANPTAEGFWFLTFTKDDAETVYVPEDAADNFSFDISTEALCWHMQRDYFSPVKGSSVTCTRVMYDALDAETSTFDDAARIVFTV
jgi:hypothetical protein